MAVILIIALVAFLVFCAGCAYKEPYYNKFFDNMTSTRIETKGLITPSATHSHTPGSYPSDPIYSQPTGFGDGSYTTY